MEPFSNGRSVVAEAHAGPPAAPAGARRLEVREHDRRGLAECLPRLEGYAEGRGPMPLSRHPAWMLVLQRGLGHVPYCLEVTDGEETRGFLPLAHVSSRLFGSFLVSLPFLNYGGAVADEEDSERLLIDRAVALAERLDVRHLELRHERAVGHPALGPRLSGKVHMRLDLPATAGGLWDGLSAKVRNQVRKGMKQGLQVAWGGTELLPEFHRIFAHNMRDLGTPCFGRGLFRTILEQFPDRAEICVVRAGTRALASALLLHGRGITEVPSASSLRRYNHTNANMLLYWSLLERSAGLGQHIFDFGRSTRDGNTYRFKRQWGAAPTDAEWQYLVRVGDAADMRPENPRYQRRIQVWRRLPVWLTRIIGPPIVRGIP
jgi:FemAB-related protein (PEP-CTERM system-associated)